MKRSILATVLFLVVGVPLTHAQVGTAFTYQGRLTDATIPANGAYDFEIKLFNALASGGQIGTTVILGDVSVAGGLFTVVLDFGAPAFTGNARWLEIGVRPGISTGAYSVLSPRQELTPSPNAIFSASAATVTGIVGVANGGTGSATLNFVDLTTAQTVGGDKTLTGNLGLGASTAAAGNIFKGANRFIHNFGTDNTFIGVNSGNFTTSGGSNTATGVNALQSNTTGNQNAASGANTLRNNTTGSQNTAVGSSALGNNTTGTANTASGTDALRVNTTGGNNVASGYEALYTNSAGSNNVGSGVQALLLNTTASKNVAIGSGALRAQAFNNGGAVWDSLNTAVGYQALFSNQPTSTTSGVQNTAMGGNALRSNTTGSGNTATGVSALQGITSGSYNTASGFRALESNTSTDGNTAIGYAALRSSTTGTGSTAAGYTALQNSTTGSDNTAFGYGAGAAVTTSSQNSFFGTVAGSLTTTGDLNSIFGSYAGINNTVGNSNAFFGQGSGNQNITGSRNTFVGRESGFLNTTGSDNIGLGYNAGLELTTGGNNIDIGHVGVAGEANTIRIGNGGTQTRAFIAGISGVTVSGGGVSAVVVDSNGQLGTGPAQTPASFSGNLVGEVTGTQGATVVSNAVSTNTASAIVRRDGSGDFAAGSATLGGNLNLASSTATTGNIMKGANRFIHNFGISNTFIGADAGNLAMAGNSNTGSGVNALSANTSGSSNTATGALALFSNTSGFNNTASGVLALRNNTSGTKNTASGTFALRSNMAGDNNTANGYEALLNNTGSGNIALGSGAGINLTSGSNNIEIGNAGVAAETNTIRIGTSGTQTRSFVAGIRGVTTGVADGIAVLIDSNGQLGTVSSSRRFKDDIADMGSASSELMRLRPVTFHYKTDRDPSERRLQYGLIAEEVAEVDPGLVARSADGQVETVLYQFLPPMLLNEAQKQRRLIESQAALLRHHADEIDSLKQDASELRLQAREIAALKQLVATMGELLKSLSPGTGNR